MKLFNSTPDTCESKHINEIYENLNKVLSDDFGLYVRRHEQPVIGAQTKYGIIIILSAEGHKYIPPEINESWVVGVFMNYLPKLGNPFDPSGFIMTPKLFELQLGITSWFEGNNSIPINDREYPVVFVGQHDPYTRQDFYNFVQNHRKSEWFIHFYEGWNKGLGPEIYSEVMSRAKIALVPCGSASLDTFRFYEAAKCGCVIMSQNQNNYSFMKNCPFLQVPNWSTAYRYIDSLVNRDLSDMSKKMYNFWEQNLSSKAAANFILEKISR
jgi:hypothetical protein